MEIHVSLYHPSSLYGEISNNNGIVETVLPGLLMLINVLNIKDFHTRTLNCCHAAPIRTIQTAGAAGYTLRSPVIRQSRGWWQPPDLRPAAATVAAAAAHCLGPGKSRNEGKSKTWFNRSFWSFQTTSCICHCRPYPALAEMSCYCACFCDPGGYVQYTGYGLWVGNFEYKINFP